LTFAKFAGYLIEQYCSGMSFRVSKSAARKGVLVPPQLQRRRMGSTPTSGIHFCSAKMNAALSEAELGESASKGWHQV
jgi:hypothetical protein